jgi:hypothetical protein
MSLLRNARRLCRRVLQGPPTVHSLPIWRALKDAPTTIKTVQEHCLSKRFN